MLRQSRPLLESTALSSMDVYSRFNSPVTDLAEIVPKEPDVNVDLLPLPYSAVTLDSVLTKTALLASLNKSALLHKSELLKVKMVVLRDSVTLNSRKKPMPKKLSIDLMVKTSTDVTSDLIYQPTVAVEEEVAVVASEAASVAVVETTEEAASEAAIDSAETEEVASEVVTDHLTVATVTVTVIDATEVATEVTETETETAEMADPLTAVVTATDAKEATEVETEATETETEVTETDAAEAVTEEVVEVVSNGIE